MDNERIKSIAGKSNFGHLYKTSNEIQYDPRLFKFAEHLIIDINNYLWKAVDDWSDAKEKQLFDRYQIEYPYDAEGFPVDR